MSGSPLRILATAGRGEGRGHLARALALAEAADELGIITSIALARGKPTAAERGRARAAGAGFTGPRALLRQAGPLVIDLRDANEAGSASLADAAVFDDREVLASPARIVVQPSLPVWTPASGARAGRELSGYAYAPLGRAIRSAIGRHPRTARPTSHVFLCFGGSDPDDLTARLGWTLAADSRWALEIVVGPDYQGTAEADGLVVEREPADFAERLANADVAVIGAGTMKFEAAALGVAAILVAAADDQVPVGPPFAATGAAVWAGDGRRLDPTILAELVGSLAFDAERRAQMSRRGPAAVPEDGARRIVAATVGESRATEVRS